jgi:hypothetical protein
MKTKICTAVLIFCLSNGAEAQSDPDKSYSNFPIIVTLQFHNFSLPFRDMKTSFSNIGIGLGTEVSYNGKQNAVQQVSAVWYRNKSMGNGLLFYSQAVWRPTINSDFYGETKAGVGYLFSFRPSKSFKQVDGKWISAGRKAKGMLTIPVGISLGKNIFWSGNYISPFVSYQFLLVKDYNKSIPVVPETLIQVGSRIYQNK